MENPAEKNEQLKALLDEAVDLLDDVKDKMGMFQTQRYYWLKKDVERAKREKEILQFLGVPQ